MKKKSSKNNNYLVILFISLFILACLIYFQHFMANKGETNNTTTQLLHFTSHNGKVSFNYPTTYKLAEKLNDISLKKNDSYILLYHIGTNYTDLTGYLDSLEKLNDVQFIERTEVQINGLKGLHTTTIDPKTKMLESYSYFFYPEQWTVYSISTDSKELRADVDKIAESFKYTP